MNKKEKINNIYIIICLIPIIIGIILYNKLPINMPIHFDYNNNIDNYMNKNIVLFIYPVIMSITEYLIIKINNKSINNKILLVIVLESIIPLITIISYLILILTALNNKIDVSSIMILITSIISFIIGLLILKTNYKEGKLLFNKEIKNKKEYNIKKIITSLIFILISIILLIIK